MAELEFEFRVYRTPEKNRKRECIVARSVPHALQVWDESVDSFSRSLELVISGGWLMQLLELQNGEEGLEKPDEVCTAQRSKVEQLCIEGLTSTDDHHMRRCLEEILVEVGGDLAAIKNE